MKTTTPFLALAAVTLVAAISTPCLAADLVPYRGTVAGEISGNPVTGLDSDIQHQGLHVGKGTQVTTSIDFGAVVDLLNGEPKPISGTATTLAANGDQLFLNFVLIPAGQGASGQLLYSGSYQITGGTGRFDYAAAGVSGDLGSGALDGEAFLAPSPAGLTITFSHDFDGTLARPVGK